MKKAFTSAIFAGLVALFATSGTAQVPAVVALNASALAPVALSVAAPRLEAAKPVGAFALLPSSMRDGPDPSTGWVFAAGFLALVVLRRVGSQS